MKNKILSILTKVVNHIINILDKLLCPNEKSEVAGNE